jgi:glycosyltransferase involved in cell wall biosynthesis
MSKEFSICIPVLNDRYIHECLNSIFASKFQDFEVIVNDVSDNFYVSDQISEYDVRIIKKKTRSFESRLITAKASSADKIIIFDDTRLMPNTLLDKLRSMPEDMTVIAEKDVGKGLLIKLSNLDKGALIRNTVKLHPVENKSIIPRAYRRDFLMKALDSISNNLSQEAIESIVGLDLEIIYYEAFKFSQNIGIVSEPEVLHHGDKTLRSIFRKYYRYGYTQRMLMGTVYSDMANLKGRNRSDYAIKDRILSLPLQMIRGVPFVLGYLTGEKELR